MAGTGYQTLLSRRQGQWWGSTGQRLPSLRHDRQSWPIGHPQHRSPEVAAQILGAGGARGLRQLPRLAWNSTPESRSRSRELPPSPAAGPLSSSPTSPVRMPSLSSRGRLERWDLALVHALRCADRRPRGRPRLDPDDGGQAALHVELGLSSAGAFSGEPRGTLAARPEGRVRRPDCRISPRMIGGSLLLQTGSSETRLVVALRPADGTLVWAVDGAAPSTSAHIVGCVSVLLSSWRGPWPSSKRALLRRNRQPKWRSQTPQI